MSVTNASTACRFPDAAGSVPTPLVAMYQVLQHPQFPTFQDNATDNSGDSSNAAIKNMTKYTTAVITT